MSVLLLFMATLICVATFVSLRSTAPAGAAVTYIGFDGVSVLFGFVAFTLAAAALGIAFGFSILASFVLHELGHVLAYRMLGHRETRFRLVPVLSKLPISDQSLKSEGEAFFVALMGPAFSLAPMSLAAALSVALAGPMPEISDVLRMFAIACGSLNFVTLLPFWPLDGGKCARIAANNFWPALAPAMTVFMCAALASAALRTGSLGLLVIAAVGVFSLVRKGESFRKTLGPDAGLIALAAYTFTLAAHFLGGWTLLHLFF